MRVLAFGDFAVVIEQALNDAASVQQVRLWKFDRCQQAISRDDGEETPRAASRF
jgi:hypothetical protein